MIANGRTRLAAVVLAAAGLLAGWGAAQAQPLPPAPAPVPAPLPVPAATPLPGPPPALGAPVPAPFPAPPPPPPPPIDHPFPPAGGSLAPPDSGAFFDVELDFLKPHLKNQLSGTVTFPGGSTDTFQTPAVSLPWTVAPRFEVGYNFGDDFGSLSAAYRFLVSQGNGTVTDARGTFDVRSRLSLDQFDFDYTSGRFSPAPFLDLKYRIGARLADVYFDDRADDGVLLQKASNNFLGAGPHFGLDADRRIGLVPGLALFGRADGAILIGEIQQRFSEGLDGTTFFGDDERRRTETVPTLTFQAGLSYTPPRMDFIHFTAGYQFEQWWNIGQLGASRGELTDQGFFLRGELDY